MMLLGVIIFNVANFLMVFGAGPSKNGEDEAAQDVISFFYYFIIALILILGLKLPGECTATFSTLCLVHIITNLLFWNKKWYSRCLIFTMIQFCTGKEVE